VKYAVIVLVFLVGCFSWHERDVVAPLEKLCFTEMERAKLVVIEHGMAIMIMDIKTDDITAQVNEVVKLVESKSGNKYHSMIVIGREYIEVYLVVKQDEVMKLEKDNGWIETGYNRV